MLASILLAHLHDFLRLLCLIMHVGQRCLPVRPFNRQPRRYSRMLQASCDTSVMVTIEQQPFVSQSMRVVNDSIIMAASALECP